MGLFSNSLSSDGVDIFNYKLMVLAMLILSAFAFIIPLHPTFQVDSESQSKSVLSSPPTKISDQMKTNHYNVYCWLPNQFTNAHSKYGNTFCENSFNAAVRGEENTAVYSLLDSEMIPQDDYRSILAANFWKGHAKTRYEQEESRREEAQDKNRVEKLVTYQVPIMFMVAAICLLLPQIIWTFLADCFSPFNLGQTLEEAQQGDSKENQLESIQKCIRSSNTASILYLVKKVLSILVAIVLLVVFARHALPAIEQFEKDLEPINLQAENNSISQLTNSNDLIKPPNDTFLCDFKIRQLQAMQHYTVQCIASLNTNTGQNDEATSLLYRHTKSSKANDKILVEFESTMVTIGIALLAILTVGNVLSLCTWIYKLMSASSRNSVYLSSNAAMDLVFLVQMARINASIDTAHRLAQGVVKDHSGEIEFKDIAS